MQESLRARRHGIGTVTVLDTVHSGVFPCGEIKLTDAELYERLLLPTDKKMNRTTLLAVAAAKEALESSGGKISENIRTGLIGATTVGGMTSTERHFHEYATNPDTHVWIDKLNCGDSTADLAKCIGHTGFITTISTACSSSANAIILGSNLIKAGVLDRVICGGADALSKFTINGFNSLMLLEKKHCKPFDADRQGLNLGEGAGFVVLESERIVHEFSRKKLAEVAGYANVNDAFHQTASSPDGAGAQAAMRAAMEMANIQPSQIDYVNAHGTGTPNNDASEANAMKALFGKTPLFSSTKAYTGHTLAAAGGIEAVICVLSLQNGTVFPNLNYTNRTPELDTDPVTDVLENLSLNYILSNSFGFGGNNTSLLFKS